MSPPPPEPSRERSPVLRLSRGWAEWLSYLPDGSPHCVRQEVQGESAADLASAALTAARDVPRGQRRCILALTGGLVSQRTIDLPPMSLAQRKAVLARKAAGLLELEADSSLYSALELAEDSAKGAAGKATRWLLVAQERSFAGELRRILEAGDLRVQRVVSTTLAHLDAAQALRGSIEPACLVIDIGEDEISVGLIAERAIHHMTVLPGNLSAIPTLAMTLMHELRTLEAFWRKESRGGDIGQVVMLGLDFERGEALGVAVRTVLPRAELTLEPSKKGGLGAGRLASLSTCDARGPFTLDIGARRPLRVGRVLAVGAALIALLGAFALWSQRGVERRTEQVRAEAGVLARAASDLEQLRTATAATRGSLAELTQELQLLDRTASLGLDLEQCLHDVLAACGPRAQPLSIHARAPWDGQPGELVVSGETDPDPVRSTLLLARVADRLEGSENFSDVEVLVPGSLPGDGAGNAQGLGFGLSARLEER